MFLYALYGSKNLSLKNLHYQFIYECGQKKREQKNVPFNLL